MIQIANRQPWMDEAICAQVDGDLWFPENGDSGTAKRAKKICRGCPVKQACLQHALDTKVPLGIFGGKSERERRKILKAAA